MYFNDFSSTTDLTIVGNGVFEDDADARFGKIFHNDPTNTSKVRTNYLQLPSDVLSHSATSKEMTIGVWVNKKSEDTFWFSPLFAAYGAAPNNGNTTPMLVCETRGLLQLNNWGYCDFGINDNPAGTSYNDGTPYVSTVWLDDGNWHYYTVVFTTTTAKVYIDGVLKNGWTVDGTSPGQVISGLLEHGDELSYITLGGNQAWTWNDADPAFGFDDFAVYDAALSADQIAQIMTNKTHYTVNAVDGNSNILKVLADANSSTTPVSVTYPRYILDGTTLREAAATSSTYSKSFELTSSNQTSTISYTNSSVDNVYFYAEGEDVLTTIRTPSASQSFSMNKVGHTANSTTFVKVATLPAGTWTIKARYFCGNKTGAHNAYIKIGSEVKWSQEYADGGGGNAEKSSESFTLEQPADMYVAADGGNATGFDWFYVSGTPSNTILGKPDCSTDYLVEMSDKVTLAPGQSWHYKFVNHNMGSTAGWAQNWVLPVYTSDGTTKIIVIRSDNWEDIKNANTGFGWTTSSGNWFDNFVTEMDNATVDMAVNYSSTNVLTMSATITTSTDRTLTYTYNSSTAGVSLSDNIKMAVSVSHSWLELIESWPTTVSGTITPAGWSTFACPYALDLSTLTATSGATAYYASAASGSTVTLKPTGDVTVPAGEGIMVKGTAGETFTINVAASETAISGNLLKGQITTGTVDASNKGNNGKYHYVFGYESSSVYGFYNLASDTEIPAGKAYLETTTALSTSADSRISIVFADDEATGIADVRGKAEVAREGIFNLSGQRVSQPTKGLYIKNGKKVIMK